MHGNESYFFASITLEACGLGGYLFFPVYNVSLIRHGVLAPVHAILALQLIL